MSETCNVYCDESCHLEHDGIPVMVLGAVWCPFEKTREIATRIREIKERHGLSADFEIKWTKVSPAKQRFYLDVLDYFFGDDNLHFRALIVPDKSKLDHERFQQDHDTWYYKMYFQMLQPILTPQGRFNIYLDIKDTRSTAKVTKLHEVLCNNIYDFDRGVIEKLQTVRSHEVEQLQIADLLIGIVGCANRGEPASRAKASLVERMKEMSGYDLTRTTLLKEPKVNLFRWAAQER